MVGNVCIRGWLCIHMEGLIPTCLPRHILLDCRFAGVERADSLTWNPHKLLGTLLQCSTFHLREKGMLADCNTMEAR